MRGKGSRKVTLLKKKGKNVRGGGQQKASEKVESVTRDIIGALTAKKVRTFSGRHGTKAFVQRAVAAAVVRSGVPEDTQEALNRLAAGFGKVVDKNSKKLDREKYRSLLAQRVRDMMDL